eukprot:1130426-Pyramimonas_sp.AAC.1
MARRPGARGASERYTSARPSRAPCRRARGAWPASARRARPAPAFRSTCRTRPSSRPQAARARAAGPAVRGRAGAVASSSSACSGA